MRLSTRWLAFSLGFAVSRGSSGAQGQGRGQSLSSKVFARKHLEVVNRSPCPHGSLRTDAHKHIGNCVTSACRRGLPLGAVCIRNRIQVDGGYYGSEVGQRKLNGGVAFSLNVQCGINRPPKIRCIGRVGWVNESQFSTKAVNGELRTHHIPG